MKKERRLALLFLFFGLFFAMVMINAPVATASHVMPTWKCAKAGIYGRWGKRENH